MAQKQLFTYFQGLDRHIPSRDELGSVIGYSVMGSLCSFETNSGSPEERIFQQVRAVYAGLDTVLETLRHGEALREGRSSSDGFAVLCDLKIEINPVLREYLSQAHPLRDNRVGEKKLNYEEDEEEKDRVLLLPQFSVRLSAKRGNYEDHLRRGGLGLLRAVTADGPLDGTRRILLNDYAKLGGLF